MNPALANLSTHDLTVARLSGALGIPVIEGAIAASAGTVIEVEPAQLDQYRALITPGSLAVLDRAAGAFMVRLGATDTWLLASAGKRATEHHAATEDDAEPLLLDAPEYALDTDRANRVASRIAQAEGFAVVARKPAFRDDFARPFVLDWYDAEANDWHVREIATRARNLWEYGVLPRDAKAMRDAGEDLPGIARALGVPRARAKWAVELPAAHEMTAYL